MQRFLSIVVKCVLVACASVSVGGTRGRQRTPQLKKAGDVISPCNDPGVPYTLQGLANTTGRFREISVTIDVPSEVASVLKQDSLQVSCGVILPASYSESNDARVYPVILAFSGGPQQFFNWNDWAARYFEVSADAGFGDDWIVISPIAPSQSGITFFTDAGAALVPAIFKAVQDGLDFTAEGNGFHCIGNSNGGVSCFHAALQSPDLVHSITAHTGFSLAALKLSSTAALNALAPLSDIPIWMHVGDKDCFRFHQSMAKTKAVLEELNHPDFRYNEYSDVGHFNVVSDIIADETSGRLKEGWDWLESRRNVRQSADEL